MQRKSELTEFAQIKEEKRLFKQRDRLMESAWRNGVTGIKVLPNDDP